MAIKFILREIMEKQGLTNKDIEEMGVNREMVETFVLGDVDVIDCESLDKLCKGLNVYPGNLIKYFEE